MTKAEKRSEGKVQRAVSGEALAATDAAAAAVSTFIAPI